MMNEQNVTPLARFEQARIAYALSDYLRSIGIESVVIKEGRETVLCVVDPAQVDAGVAVLEDFKKDPLNAKYRAASWTTPTDLNQADLGEQYQNTVHWKNILQGRGVVTIVGAVLCIALFVLLNISMSLFDLLSFPVDSQQQIDLSQPWRLLTPAIMHYDLLHLLSNLIWWWLLAAVVERHQSSLQLLLLFLITGLSSNLFQFYYSGPNFLGLSGVVYGLLGYIWMYGLVNPRAGFRLNMTIVWMMLIWLLLCFTGMFGAIANAAHMSGLAVGMGAGVLFGLLHR